MEKFKQKIGEEAFCELEKIIQREINLLNLGEADVKVKMEAIKLLMEWLNKVYELDHGHTYAPEFTLSGMFITREIDPI